MLLLLEYGDLCTADAYRGRLLCQKLLRQGADHDGKTTVTDVHIGLAGGFAIKPVEEQNENQATARLVSL